MSNLFDIIICVGPNDTDIITSMVPYAISNVIGYRNIYLVCANPTISVDGTITIDEKIFPFNINDLIAKFGNNNRNGWYLQQLLKLYPLNTYILFDRYRFLVLRNTCLPLQHSIKIALQHLISGLHICLVLSYIFVLVKVFKIQSNGFYVSFNFSGI